MPQHVQILYIDTIIASLLVTTPEVPNLFFSTTFPSDELMCDFINTTCHIPNVFNVTDFKVDVTLQKLVIVIISFSYD